MQKDNFLICENCDFSGVYILLNMKNYKCYIGSSRNIKRRLNEHKAALEHKKHMIKNLQNDYDNGCKFIAYPLSEVQLLNRKYNIDKNLRYYENEAIKLFEAANPQKGYNANIGSDDKSNEYSNIYWKKVALESFINTKEQKYFNSSTKDRNNETRKFIRKMLKGD